MILFFMLYLHFSYIYQNNLQKNACSHTDKDSAQNSAKYDSRYWMSPLPFFQSTINFLFPFALGQFTRNYTQTVKRAADNKRRYAPGWVHSTCLLRGFPKGAAPHLAHDFAEQSVVCYTLCRRCPENTVAAGEGKGI